VAYYFAPSICLLVFKSTEYTGFLRIILFTLAFSLGAEVPLSLLRILEKSTLFTIISIGKLILSISLNILFIVGFKWGIMGILISGLISNGLVSLYLFFYTCRKVGLGFNWFQLKEMLAYGLPWVPGGVAMFIINFSDRFFLQRMVSLSDVGIYSLGYKFGMVINMLVMVPFLQAWGPKRFEVAKNENAKNIYAIVLTYFLYIEIFCALGIATLIKDSLHIMSTPDFWPAYRVVPIILLSYILQGGYHCIQIGILLTKRTKNIAIITVISAVVNLTLNFLMIQRWGMMGAAWATLFSFVVMFTLNYVITDRIYHVPYEIIRIVKMLGTAAALYFISYFVTISTLSLSFIFNLGLALSFPFILYLLGFYTPGELIRAKEVAAFGLKHAVAGGVGKIFFNKRGKATGQSETIDQPSPPAIEPPQPSPQEPGCET
jgi:O-antigen/teichoic acid export membrane protein